MLGLPSLHYCSQSISEFIDPGTRDISSDRAEVYCPNNNTLKAAHKSLAKLTAYK